MHHDTKPPKGVPFSDDNARAIEENRKTQFRLPMKVQATYDPTGRWSYCVSSTDNSSRDTWGYLVVDPAGSCYTERGIEREVVRLKAPYRSSELLYCRQTFAIEVAPGIGSRGPVVYRTDCDRDMNACPFPRAEYGRWKHARYMKREQARPYLLEVVGVHAERLQDISEKDAEAEGVSPAFPVADKRWVVGFRRAWNAKHGEGAWDRNDWVWAYTFKRIEANGQESEHAI